MPKPHSLAIALSHALVSQALAGGTTITVTTEADEQNVNTACSLREALINAASDDQSGSTDCPTGAGVDTIALPADQTITLNSALPDLQGFFSLNGNNSTITRGGGCNLDGTTDAGEFRLLTVGPGENLVLSQITLSNGCADGSLSAGEGGAVYVGYGQLTLSSSTLSNNSAIGGGGALACRSNGLHSCSANDSLFQGNVATLGGAIYTDGANGNSFTSRFLSNTASSHGGALHHQGGSRSLNFAYLSANVSGGNGGAVWFDGPGTYDELFIDRGVFVANTAVNGGAAFLSGDIRVDITTFSSNSASGNGGALYLDNASASLTLRDSSLIDNGAGSGDQLFMSSESSASISHSLLVGLESDNCAGALTLLSGSHNLTTDDSCQRSGIDLVDRSALALGPLADNGSSRLTHALGPSSAAIDAGDTSCLGVDARDVARPIDGNNDSTALCDIGAFEFENAAQAGPDFVVNRLSDINDGQCTDGLDGCSLREAVIAANGNGDDSVISFDPDVFAGTLTSTLTLGQITISTPVTLTGPGSERLTLDANSASRHFNINGAGLFAAALSDLRLIGGNSAASGGAINSNEGLSLSRMRFEGNTATDNGGAVAANGVSPTIIQFADSTFVSNQAEGTGGAVHISIFNTSSSIDISNSSFSSNQASSGGGLYITASESSLSLSSLTINTNTATSGSYTNGGGIFLRSGDNNASLQGLQVLGNQVHSTGGPSYGGGLALISLYGTLTLSDSTVSGNSATSDSDASSGGGLFIYGYESNVLIERTTIDGNSATSFGGGASLYNGRSASTTIRSSTLSGNSVDGFGAGLSTKVGTLARVTLEGSTVTANIADNDDNASGGGGGLYLDIDSVNTVSLQGSVVAANQDLNAGAAPDIQRNGRNLVLNNSIIGDNAGSDLIEAPIGSPNLGFNLIGSAAGGGVIDPMLDPLADNGGASFTHLPADASPLIDHYFVCSGSDQLGRTRGIDADGEVGNDCDVGAVELADTIFRDGFENGVITKRFEQRNIVLNRAEIAARLGPARSQALLMRAGSAKRNGNLVLLHARQIGDQIQLQLNRYEHGEWTQGAWQTMRSETVQLRW
ncbi:CSLREA domain-containing protein [Pseudomarimonas arenosa]|uniref:CSLREA domain-containing protein n=1 Tax=Pseudomarimonas arenosa TaxID=2774145 RepID=A0AAW3ZHY6_9GAMM|nr:CSLREA domain-containing protein [Pseudomarimonas arenosa]MBD8525398.1 CSLREA domain-containing protein [Pseudomarimonas arenosa]